MRLASHVLATAAAVTLLVASAAAPVSADRGPLPWDCVATGTCCFVTKPPPTPLRLPAIDVMVARVDVSDAGIDRSRIRRRLRQYDRELHACFGHEDSVEAVFVISPDGGVLGRPVTTAKDPWLGRCVGKALARISYPTHAEDDDVAVTEVSVTIIGRTHTP